MTSEADLVARRVQNLSILAREKVASFLSGNRRSLFKGQGTEFADLREFAAGDDTRYIDWRASAKRYNALIVRDYELEKNTNIVMLLDASGSMLLGKNSTRISKAVEAIASLAFAAVQNKDFIGFNSVSGKQSINIPPKGGKNHEYFIYRQLLNIIPTGSANIGEALKNVVNSLHHRSLIIVVSDLHNNIEETLSGFRMARAFKHEIQLIQISDYNEFVLPDNLGKIKFLHENKPVVVDLSDTLTYGRFSYEINKRVHEINSFKRKLRGLKVRVVEVKTENIIEQVLLSYYSAKSRHYSI